MAKNDYQSKKVFEYFNRPSEMRAFIDSVFFSLELYRKISRNNPLSEFGETSPDNEHADVVDQQNEPEQNIDGTEIHGADPTSDTKSEDSLEEADLHFHKKLEALQQSGVLVDSKDFVAQIAHFSEDTSTELLTDETYSATENSEHDGTFLDEAYDTPSEIPEDSTAYPEFYPEAKHFTKDWSRTRFPPVKIKTVVYANVEEPETEHVPYDTVPKFHKAKSVLKKEQAAYIASEAVEGALELADTIARATSQLVNRIIMGALKHKVDESQHVRGHFRQRIPKVKLPVMGGKPSY